VKRFVLITRHPSDCVELQGFLTSSGLTLRPYPVLRLEDVVDDPGWQAVSRALPEIGASSWLVLASPRAPGRFVRMCRERGLERLLDLPAAAVGASTARAAENADLKVELVGPGNGIGLGERLVENLQPNSHVVFACGKERRAELPQILEDSGHTVLPVVVYRMVPTPPRELPPLGPSLEAVVLTSPRAAALYLEGVGGRPLPCPHFALGTTTQETAAGLGIECRIPHEPTMESLAEELCTI
jgi:uroporphyrinogen-III synthase